MQEKNEWQRSAIASEQLTLLFISGLFVFFGQSLVQVLLEAGRWQAYLLSAFGMFLFLLTTLSFTRGHFPRWFHRPVQSISNWLHLTPPAFHLLWSAPIFSLITWLAAADGNLMLSAPVAIAAWLLSIVFLFASHWDKLKRIRFHDWSRSDTLAILILTLSSLVFRGVALSDIPWILTGDEGSAGLSAIEFLDGRKNNIFGTGWFSFPAMFFAIQSISIRIFGQTIFGLRLPSMLAGSLTVPALYFFARLAFGRKIAIIASAYLTTFHFHIHFSRIGLNNIWDGFFIALFSGFLWWGWKSYDSEKDVSSALFMLAGFTLGLGQYFYTSMRVVFAMLGLWIILLAVIKWSDFRNRLPGLVSLAFGILVILIPLGAFYIKHPAEFAAPIQRVSILGPWLEHEIARTGESAWCILWSQFKLAALAFTHVNVRNWYTSDHPMLLLLPSVFFLLGLVLLLVRIRDARYIWLALWFLSTIAINALSESTPSSQRITLVTPTISIIIALPLYALEEWLNSLLPKRKILQVFLPGLLLILAMAFDFNFYFGEYSGSQEFSDNNTETANAIADYLMETNTYQIVYFCGPPRMGFDTHSTIPYLVPGVVGYDVVEPILVPPTEVLNEPTVYIFLPERLDELELVKQAYPGGNIVVKKGRDHIHLFTAYQLQ